MLSGCFCLTGVKPSVSMELDQTEHSGTSSGDDIVEPIRLFTLNSNNPPIVVPVNKVSTPQKSFFSTEGKGGWHSQ